MEDFLLLLCFLAGASVTGVFLWPWNRKLRRDADHWYKQYRSRDEALARIAEANARAAMEPK